MEFFIYLTELLLAYENFRFNTFKENVSTQNIRQLLEDDFKKQ